MGLEEREDAPLQVAQPVDRVGRDAAAWALAPDAPASEEGHQSFEHRSMHLVLVHVEDRVDLPSPRPLREARVVMDRDGEATLPVHEADHPAGIELEPRRRSFLLIVRTGRIVTAHRHMIPVGCDNERVPPDTRMFQQIARFYNSRCDNNRYSYGRRLPGLRFRASPCG
jgi:hypothetical protein